MLRQERFGLRDNIVDALPGGLFIRSVSGEVRRDKRKKSIISTPDGVKTNKRLSELVEISPLVLALLALTYHLPAACRSMLFENTPTAKMLKNIALDFTTTIAAFEATRSVSTSNMLASIGLYIGVKSAMSFAVLEGKSLWKDLRKTA